MCGKLLMRLSVALAATCCIGAAPSPKPVPNRPLNGMEVAVTIDDVPAGDRAIDDASLAQINRDLRGALKDNGVPAQAFVTTSGFGLNPAALEILKDWLKAAFPLGNHTYSHLDLDTVSAAAYIADIDKLDALLLTLAPVSPLIEKRRVFRFPYLSEGEPLAKRDAVRAHLAANGYRIAEVTIDYSDWAWNDVYRRCAAVHDETSMKWLRGNIGYSAARYVRHSRAFARALFSRDIKQILLIHAGALEADTLAATLKGLRAKGVKFISLEEALEDPVYQINPNVAYAGGETFLTQVASTRKINIDRFADHKYTLHLLNRFCVDTVPAGK
jgi:peptidoglycan/xylan/chitin deacetylase (PgdA/CDA1 family)